MSFAQKKLEKTVDLIHRGKMEESLLFRWVSSETVEIHHDALENNNSMVRITLYNTSLFEIVASVQQVVTLYLHHLFELHSENFYRYH